MYPLRSNYSSSLTAIDKSTSHAKLAHSWVFQESKEEGKEIAKPVISTTELWTPALGQVWILKHIHTQHKEASPSLLHSPSSHAFPSSVIQGMQ